VTLPVPSGGSVGGIKLDLRPRHAIVREMTIALTAREFVVETVRGAGCRLPTPLETPENAPAEHKDLFI
jgi:hypothetical protein